MYPHMELQWIFSEEKYKKEILLNLINVNDFKPHTYRFLINDFTIA